MSPKGDDIKDIFIQNGSRTEILFGSDIAGKSAFICMQKKMVKMVSFWNIDNSKF